MNEYNLLLEEYDNAIIGISTEDNVVYDYYKMVECACDKFKMSFDESVEYLDKKVIPTLLYYNEPKPIVVYNNIDMIYLRK